MKARTRPQRLAKLLTTSAVALCLTLGLPALPGFDLSLQPAFAKGLGGKGGKGGSGGKADRGGKADKAGGAGKADKGGPGGQAGQGGKGGPGGGGGKAGGGKAERGGAGGQAGAAAEALGAGPAEAESALAAPEEQTEETLEEGLLPKSGGGDDFDRRASGLDSASSLSTTAGLNRFLWILPPEEVAAATQGEVAEEPVGAAPQNQAATGQAAKIEGAALPLRAVLAVPLDLPPRPGGKPFFVKLPPKPVAKPIRALARSGPASAQAGRAAGLATEAPGPSEETAAALPSGPAIRDRRAEEPAAGRLPAGEAVIFGVDDAPPEIGTEAVGRAGPVPGAAPFYDAPEGPARDEERALEAEETDERGPAAQPEEGQARAPATAPLLRDGGVDSEAPPSGAGGEEASLGLRLRGAIAQAISWGSSLLFAADGKS